jgi:hypothetical protein
MEYARFLAMSVLLIIAVLATAYLMINVVQRYAVAPTPTPKPCSLAAIEAVYLAKIRGGPEISDAVQQAIAQFGSAQDPDALVFKSQLNENERENVITPAEHAQLLDAIAAYRFVRDNITYSAGVVGIERAQDDITTLKSRQGKCDEKSLLLISMFRFLNISSGMEALSTSGALSVDACASEGICACLVQADHVVVTAKLPAFAKLRTFNSLPHYTGTRFCTKGGYLVLDPTCSDCPFAFGRNCTVSITILNSTANQTAG